MSTAMTFLLPPEAYYSTEWWEAEHRLLFGRTYNLVAYESDVPNPGDCIEATAGADRIVVVRMSDGEIQAHPHAQTPKALAVGRFAGMVFVHPSDDAPPFAEWLGDFVAPERAGPYDWDDLVEVDRIDVPLRCNWKLYIENHVDLYHLWYLHGESLGMYDHTELTSWQAGPHWGCVEAVRPGMARTRPGMLPITSIPAEERSLLRANLIFPNVPMTTMETSVMTYQVIPTGPETCRLDLRIRGQRGSEVADRDAFLKVQRDEDGTVCEQIQEAIRSPRFAVGPLAAEYEQPILRFQEEVLALLRA
jgi:phenylpropionate dioxygenase-like ring-hydroxylating dioxygenase large terminal subunit